MVWVLKAESGNTSGFTLGTRRGEYPLENWTDYNQRGEEKNKLENKSLLTRERMMLVNVLMPRLCKDFNLAASRQNSADLNTARGGDSAT